MKKKSKKPASASAAAEPTKAAKADVPSASKKPLVNPWGLLAAAWLIPGAGHFLLGDRRRAAGFLGLVLLATLLGVYLDGGLYWDLRSGSGPLMMLASLANLGAGLCFLVLQFLVGYGGNPRAPFYEHGSAFFITAGLLNVVLMLNAWDLTWGLPVSPAEAEEGEAA